MASVYVSGDPTKSLKQFQDVDVDHDHSYYGLGCASSSDIPCTTRIVQTFDGENQKNGVYYTFQAAASGSGGKSLSDDNTNSPDTFCPLGWQLPYSGTGGDYYDKSRSWGYLFTAYSISFNAGATADATKIKSYPFSYVYPGYYDWATGRLYSLGTSTGLWASTVNNSTGAYFMATWSTEVHSNLTTNRARGYTLRCAVCFSIPFIDGTVEGTDIHFPDSDYTHDHTYYGNGCPNNGGTGQPGATEACDKRILKTLDDEYQENGTYYNFQAVTDGTGAAIQTDNANAPDSFCPIGWQLPYGGTGGDYYNKPKSWEYLFVTAYNYDISQMQQTTDKIRSYPHSFIMTGYYNNYNGVFYEQGADGLYSTSTSKGQLRYLLFYFPGYIVISYGGGRNNDYPLRCVLGISNLKVFHGIRVRL